MTHAAARSFSQSADPSPVVRPASLMPPKAPGFFSRLFTRIFGDGNEIVLGDFCAMCNDVHENPNDCTRALTGWCCDCLRYQGLDHFGRCGQCGSQSVTSRHLTSSIERRPAPLVRRTGKKVMPGTK